MWGAVLGDFFSCCTTRGRESNHLLPAVPRSPNSLARPSASGFSLAATPSASGFWFRFWGIDEKKAEEKAGPENHVGLRELSKTHSQIHMLKEQVKLLQRHNEQLMNYTLPTQTTHDTQDEDLALLKSQLAELKNRNAQLEDELTSHDSSRSPTSRRPQNVQRSVKASISPSKRPVGVPPVNVAEAAAQVANRGPLKKKQGVEDDQQCIDLTKMRPPSQRQPMRVEESDIDITEDDNVCDLTSFRARRPLQNMPSRQ